MLKLIINLKKKYNFSLGICKKILEKNNFDYNKTIKYIENISNIKLNFYKYYFLISIKKKQLFCIKIEFNSIILNNSNIIKELIELISKNNINKKNIIKILNLYSIKLNEKIFFSNFLIFKNENLIFYNHKNLFLPIIKFKKKIEKNLCYTIINKKVFFIFLFNCNLSLINQICVKKNLIIKKFLKCKILFIYYIYKKTIFLYE